MQQTANTVSPTRQCKNNESVRLFQSGRLERQETYEQDSFVIQRIVITIYVPVSCISVKQRNLCNP